MVASDVLRAPTWAFQLAVMIGVTLFAFICYTGVHGYWWAAGLVAWFSSHGLMVIARCIIGGHSLSYVFNYHTQSKALLADAALAAGIAAASYGWNFLPASGWYRHPAWFVGSYIIGMAIGLSWHLLLDRPNYQHMGAEALLHDPWKIAHDVTTYPVLSGALIALCIPVISSDAMWPAHWWVPVIPLVGLACWAVGCIKDSSGLDVYMLHDTFNWVTRHYEPRPRF